MHFTVKFADIKIALDSQYKHLQSHCKDYCIPECEPDICIKISQEDIEAERDHDDAAVYTNEYLETVAALRKVAEVLPLYNRVLCHGAVITYDNVGAFLFTAPSGTGKTTHIKLWKKCFGQAVEIVNGDKPFFEVKEDGVQVYGTPWAGKEGWQKNRNAPLKGVCFVKRGTVNSIRRMETLECLELFMQQIYLPKDGIAAGKTLELVEKILERVPVYVLTCDISEEAVKCSFEMLTGLEYESHSIKKKGRKCI